jgi:hypothetical protein
MENIGQAALYFNGKVPTTYAAIGLGYGGGTGSENLPLAYPAPIKTISGQHHQSG